MVKVNNAIDHTKGSSDDKAYRFLTLDNKLECLLISSRYSKQADHDSKLNSIINDRRMSVRHSKVALVKPHAAKDVILGETLDLAPPVEQEEATRPPSLPQPLRNSVNLHRMTESAVGLLPGTQRLSAHSNRKKKSVPVNPSNLNRISLFSELKPIVRVHQHNRSHGEDELVSLSDSINTRTANKRRTYVRSGSMTIPGNLMLNVNDAEISRVSMAAVSMAVAVGSFAEPDEHHGLAHFLEHMLFLGSEKYPEENHFDKFLADAGGSSNAYTDAERSVYHFNCPQEHLKEALRIFSHFFIDPLLNPASGCRELESIQEEFNLRKNDDECLSLELWRQSARKDTPFSRFTCGNKGTLLPLPGDTTIFNELRRFHQKYYVAENMKLVIQTALDIDELQDITTEIFTKINSLNESAHQALPSFVDKGLPWRLGDPSLAKRLKKDKSIWDSLLVHDIDRPEEEVIPPGVDGASLGCVFCTVPIQEGHKLTLIWQLPPQCLQKSTRPTDYLVALLGSNCKGSIFDAAQRRGWITGLTATCSTTDGFEDNSVCSLFKITINLTKHGFNQWTFVVGFVFEYLGMLIKDEPQKWVFDELIDVYKYCYHHAEETDAQARVQELSVYLLPQWGYKAHNVLDMGLQKELVWSEDNIIYILNQIRPELVRIDIASSDYRQPTLNESKSMFSSKKKSSTTQASSSKRIVQNFVNLKKKITRKPSKYRAGDYEAENDYYTVFNEPFRKAPEVEPFTKMQYWVERIPQHILKMWSRLLAGEISVLTSQVDTFSDEHGFCYPPMNPFIATDFKLRESYEAGVDTNSAEFMFLLGKLVEVTHDPNTAPCARIAKTKMQKNGQFFGRIKFIDVPNTSVIIQYKNGLRRWYTLPDNFFPEAQEAIEEYIHKRKQSKISHGSMKNVDFKDASSNIQDLKLDGKFDAKLHHSPGNKNYSPGYSDSIEFDANASSHWNRRSHNSDFPTFNVKDKDIVPILLPGSNALLSVWHFRQPNYTYPRAEIRCRIISDLPTKSPLEAALNDFLNLVVLEAIRADLYLAQLAEVDVNMKPYEFGQSISIYGFSHKLPRVLKTVISSFIDFAQCGSELAAFEAELEALQTPKYKRRYKVSLENIKLKRKQCRSKLYDLIGEYVYLAQLEALGQSYCNEGTNFQSTGVSSAMYRILVKNTKSPEEKAKTIVAIENEPTLLATFASNFLKRCRIEILAAGNISVAEASAMGNSVRELLKLTNSTGLRVWKVPKYSVQRIPKSASVPSGDPWCALSGLVHPLEAIEFRGHSVDLYFEVGANILSSRVLIELIEHLMKEPLYHEMRTQRQLGYMVKCSSVKLYGRVGLVIELTSGKNYPHELANEVDSFLIRFRSTLNDMSSQVFLDNTAALARKKLELKSFSQAVDQHWETIEQSFDYNSIQFKWNFLFDEVEYLRDFVTPELLLSKFDEWLMPTSQHRRKASVIVFGRDHGMNPLKELSERRDFITVINGADQDMVQSGSSPMCSIV